jgi:S1-C subfamily serine protease
MASRFIGKTSLAGIEPLRLQGRTALEEYARLRTLLAARAGPDEARLFAEPIVTWQDTGSGAGSVSWYAEAAGEPEPLPTLPLDRRAAAEGHLRVAVSALARFADDPDLGPLLQHALQLASPHGVLAVGDRLVLTEWGLVPVSGAGGLDLRSLLGTMTAAPAVSDPLPSSVSAAPVPARPAPVAVPAGPIATRPVWDWTLLPAALVAAVLFLGLGLWLGARLVALRVAERPTTVNLLDEQATRATIERQREQNAALEREIEARRRALQGNVCALDPAQVPRLGPDRAATVPPATVPPPPGGQPFQGTLADLLKQAVVLVIASGDRGAITGTGFFVTPDLIATNRHVIEDANPAKIFVTGERLGRATPVEVVAETPSSEIGSLDVALLRIQGAPSIQPLSFTPTVAPLDQVIAAGYPGLLVQADEAFGRLLHGDASAIPQLILSDGRINAIQPAASGLKIMPHSAAVSGGNSGGPLVDACGRVVGINTFIAADRDQAAHANYAQKADSVVEFLKAHGASVTDVTGPCTPGAPAAPAPQAAAAPPATPAATQPAPAAPTPAPPAASAPR